MKNIKGLVGKVARAVIERMGDVPKDFDPEEIDAWYSLKTVLGKCARGEGDLCLSRAGEGEVSVDGTELGMALKVHAEALDMFQESDEQDLEGLCEAWVRIQASFEVICDLFGIPEQDLEGGD